MRQVSDSVADVESKVDNLLARLTIEEKVWLCHGCSGMEVGDMPRLGIGKLAMADGPQGVRLEDGRTSTALPCGISLACSWDPAAAFEYGALIGREVLASGGGVSLGPGLNLMRTPLNGRNFEYYGEDPFLAGKIASGYIRGCQGEKVAATPKHIALNNQEICRTTGSSDIDERSLRELYLTGFEILTRESGPWMMMSAYNKINGVHASACGLVQQKIAKDEWGFDGVMVSDWGGAHDTKGCALGGLDLEMGQGVNSIMGEPLLKMVRDGEVPEDVVTEKARRVLRLLVRTGVLDSSRPKGEIDTPRHHAIARKLAVDGMTLLKNDNGFLPLDIKKIKTLAVVGPSSDFQHNMGPLEVCGGSGAVHPAYDATPLAGIRAFCEPRGIKVVHSPGVVFDSDSTIPPEMLAHDGAKPGLKAEYFHSADDMASGAAPWITRTDSRMRLRWSKTSLVAGGAQDNLPYADFAVRWTGSITSPRSGKARLMAACAHGGANVWLDGELVISTDQKRRFHQAGFELDAEAGRQYQIKIELVCASPEPELNILWSSDSGDSRKEAVEIASKADAVIFCGGTNHLYDKEAIGWGDVPGADIPDLELIGPQAALIRELAAANPNIAVVLVNGSVVSVESWIDKVPALLEAWYPGMEGGNAVADVLFGEASPGGRLCCTWGKKLDDYACHANGNYPGVRTGDNPHVSYDEGIFIGYRHFDRAKIEPRFPFGFGLTYSTFSIQDCVCRLADASAANPRAVVSARVVNTGPRAASEVVQLYVGDESSSEERPARELKGFKKVFLQPGESAEVELSLGWRDFAFWSSKQRKWIVEPGVFSLEVGASARDIVWRSKITLS